MSLVSATQMTLDFEPGLIERFPTLLDCIRTGAYTNRNPLKTIAADMDMSQSDLSRKLAGNPDDPIVVLFMSLQGSDPLGVE